MTELEINKIYELKEKGKGYSLIAKEMGKPVNTIKSFLLRNPKRQGSFCRYCGKKLKPSRTKPKTFCSVTCRVNWFRTHNEKPQIRVCSHCGKEYPDLGYRKSKFCSRACYLKSFKNGESQH